MKYFLLVFCLFFSSQVYGQEKGKRKGDENIKQYLGLQGGLFFDKSFNQSYTGFNLINIGWSQIKNRTQRSIQLEFIGYKNLDLIRVFIPSTNIEELRGFRYQRRSIELLYNHLFGLSSDVTNGFFIGPSGSMMFNSKHTFPSESRYTSSKEICLWFGVGMNAGYNWSIHKNIMLSVSTRVTLFHLGWQREDEMAPSTDTIVFRGISYPIAFLRDQFQLNIGLNFKI